MKRKVLVQKIKKIYHDAVMTMPDSSSVQELEDATAGEIVDIIQCATNDVLKMHENKLKLSK